MIWSILSYLINLPLSYRSASSAASNFSTYWFLPLLVDTKSHICITSSADALEISRTCFLMKEVISLPLFLLTRLKKHSLLFHTRKLVKARNETSSSSLESISVKIIHHHHHQYRQYNHHYRHHHNYQHQYAYYLLFFIKYM